MPCDGATACAAPDAAACLAATLDGTVAAELLEERARAPRVGARGGPGLAVRAPRGLHLRVVLDGERGLRGLADRVARLAWAAKG